MITPAFPQSPCPAPGSYVPETRFGEWFQRTDIWRHYVLEEAITELRALLPGDSGSFPRVLDAGCGEGIALEILQRTFGATTILAVDINADAVSAARRRAVLTGLDVDVRWADASRLPLDSGSVDLILCHQVLHHCSDPASALAEFRRVLAPGGWLLLAESCRVFLDWWPVRLFFRHPPRKQQTASEYVALVAGARFVVEPGRVMTPLPWWSRRDLGLYERLGGSAEVRQATQVRIAAQRCG